MNDHSDAVDEVLAAFSDHLAHGTPRPILDHLDAHDRQLAEDLMRLMATARRIDPSASAPSLEALLAGTKFANTLPLAVPTPEQPVLHQVQDVLTAVDSRADVHVGEGFVSFAYLDLLTRFYPVDNDDPWLPEDALRQLFDADVDVDLVALVSTGDTQLPTRVVSRYDVDKTVSTAASQPVTPPSSALPLALAARGILEQSAPTWGEFGLDGAMLDHVDVANLEAEIATRLVAEEATRRYKGDKALAYRSLVGHEHRLVELVATASRPSDPLDLAAEIDRIARQVA